LSLRDRAARHDGGIWLLGVYQISEFLPALAYFIKPFDETKAMLREFLEGVKEFEVVEFAELLKIAK